MQDYEIFPCKAERMFPSICGGLNVGTLARFVANKLLTANDFYIACKKIASVRALALSLVQ